MQFRLLGPLEVDGADGPIPVDRGKPRALLALLLLHPNEVVSTEFILEALWGDDLPDTAGHAVEVYVSRLRRLLGPDRIDRQAAGYRLGVLTGELDLERFVELTLEADAAAPDDPARAAGLLEDAERMWRGPPLQELAGTASGAAEINRLQELRLSAIEARIDARLAAGSGSELVPELERLVAAQPFRERLRGQLMLALYRAGRQADALAAYHAARAALDEELGVEPGAELQVLQVAILKQDPSLDPPRRRGVAVGAGAADAAAASRAPAPRRARPVALIGVLVFLVVGVATALQLLAGRATPPGASPSPSAAPAASGRALSPNDAELLAAVPADLGGSCESNVERSSLAVAGLHCRPAVGSEADDAWYESFEDMAGMNIAFETGMPEGVEQGDCSAKRTNVRGKWATTESTFSGDLLCFTQDGESWVVWTYLGRTIPILARASRSGDDPDDVGSLYEWWHDVAVELR